MLHYNARLLETDDTSIKTGWVAHNAATHPILCYAQEKADFYTAPVQGVLIRPPQKAFLQIEVEGGPSGRRRFAATPETLIFTPNGPKQLDALQPGDLVHVGQRDFAFTGQSLQILLGGILGDASVRLSKRGETASVRFGHGAQQTDYAAWKYSFLSPACGTFLLNAHHQPRFETKYAPFAAHLHEQITIPGVPRRKKMIARQAAIDLVEKMDLLAFAVWYMDDGTYQGYTQRWGKGRSSIAATATDLTSLERLSKRLASLGGGTSRAEPKGLVFDSANTWMFHEAIAGYIPPCMAYKIHHRLHHVQPSWEPQPNEDVRSTYTLGAALVHNVYAKPPTPHTRSFSPTVPQNSWLVVDGILIKDGITHASV